VTPPDVLAFYQSRLMDLHVSLTQAISKQAEYSWVVAAAGIVFILLSGLASLRREVSFGSLAIPSCAAAVAWQRRSRWKARSVAQLRLADFYRRGVNRLTGSWAGEGNTGEEYSRTGHLYERDLGVLGRGSLFELICTARTELGRRRLARFLLSKVPFEKVRARQAMVQTLKPKTELREKIALLGRFDFEECGADVFERWLATKTPRLPRLLMEVSSSLMACALGIIYQALPWNPLLMPWSVAAGIVVGLAAVQYGLRFHYRRVIDPMVRDACALAGNLSVLREGLALLEHKSQRKVSNLWRLAASLSNSLQGPLESFSRILLIDVHLALAMEDWKRRYGSSLPAWIDEWAEFEALNCLSGYAYEHPDDAVPELIENGACFEAIGLGHPLLHDSVRNDIELGERTKFYIVSGSNMAGKSTLLRAIGLNAVLANAGAPVRAARARISVFSITASLSVPDSLLEGKSKFLAEMERIKSAIAEARTEEPALFVMDEILSGTNSLDRRRVAEHVVRELVREGAIGSLSTHDLALTEIAEIPELRGSNRHMASREESAPLDFDFLLKPGVYAGSSAVAIARLAGVEMV
jgi:MutS domain V